MKAKDSDKSNSKIWKTIAICYLKMGKKTEAKDNLFKSIGVTQTDHEIYFLLASILFEELDFHLFV